MRDFELGASIMRELAAKIASESIRDRDVIAAAIRDLPLPADPASGEGTDALDLEFLASIPGAGPQTKHKT